MASTTPDHYVGRLPLARMQFGCEILQFSKKLSPSSRVKQCLSVRVMLWEGVMEHLLALLQLLDKLCNGPLRFWNCR